MAQNDDMMDGDMDRSRGKDKAPAPKKKKGGMLLILLGVVAMVVIPAATFFAIRLGGGTSPEAAEKAAARKPAAPPVVISIDPALVVNISGTRMTRILRMQVHLVLSDASLDPVIKEMAPMVKDRIMATAGRRTLDELESVDDRESLKRDIALEVNSLVRSRMAGSVLDVAFSEFLIQ